MKSVFVTDSTVVPAGHGGGTVSYHELQALTRVTEVSQVYQRIGKLWYEDPYPANPFMYDYFIASLVKPENIDIAHFYGANFALTSKMLRNSKRSFTVPAHNLEESLTEWLKYPDWGTLPPHLTNEYIFRLLTQAIVEPNITVVAPSTLSAKYLKAKFNVDAKIIPHGVDIPPKWNIDRTTFKIFHLSQYGPDKGQIYLLQALKKFGKGESVICSRGIFTELAIPNLTIKQEVTEEEKSNLYLNASVYVQPSVTEGWGLEVLEAMAHGTPVIVSAGTGAVDAIEDGRDGFIVPVRDPDAIVAKLQYFFDNPMEVRRMGHNARITAEKYAWNIIEKQYEALFQR